MSFKPTPFGMSVDEMETFRVFIKDYITSPAFIDEYFEATYKAARNDIEGMRADLPRMTNPLQEDMQMGFMNLTFNFWTIFQIAEALAANLIQTRKEFADALDALGSKSMTKAETARALAKVRKNILAKTPNAEEMRDIKWVRNFLRKASAKGGKGS